MKTGHTHRETENKVHLVVPAAFECTLHVPIIKSSAYFDVQKVLALEGDGVSVHWRVLVDSAIVRHVRPHSKGDRLVLRAREMEREIEIGVEWSGGQRLDGGVLWQRWVVCGWMGDWKLNVYGIQII